MDVQGQLRYDRCLRKRVWVEKRMPGDQVCECDRHAFSRTFPIWPGIGKSVRLMSKTGFRHAALASYRVICQAVPSPLFVCIPEAAGARMRVCGRY